jgi:hypothetical protein
MSDIPAKVPSNGKFTMETRSHQTASRTIFLQEKLLFRLCDGAAVAASLLADRPENCSP